MEVPIQGYAPDLDPRTPGVLTNCAALIPSIRGMKGAPTPVATPLAALAAACTGAAILEKTDGSTRLIAGTTTELFEAGVSTWNTVTAASGDYSGAAAVTWDFAQFGDTTIAVNKNDIVQTSDSSVFANASTTAPKASIVETANNFVILFDVFDQGGIYDSADRTNGWWTAGRGGTTVWTPSVANECYTGELSSTPGPVIAGKRFGDQVIAYKEFSMFRGYYLGSQGWQFDEIPGEAGAISKRAVINVGTTDNPLHLIMGPFDFWIYDGSRPRSIGSDLKDTIFAELDRANRKSVKTLHSKQLNVVYWFYPVSGGTTPDKCVVYNYKTGKWGRDDRTIEEVTDYIDSGITWDSLGDDFSTWDDLFATTWDESFLQSGLATPAIFDTSHNLKTLSGVAGTTSMTTGDYGSVQRYSTVTRVTPIYITYPDSGQLTHSYRNVIGESLTSDSAIGNNSKGEFDVLRSAPWHRDTIQFSGAVEIAGLNVELSVDGDE